MRIETESGVIQVQAKRHLEPPKAVRGEDTLLEYPEGSEPY